MTDQTYTDAKAAIDASLFKVNPQEGQYIVRVDVEGYVEIDLTADSEDAARAEVEEMIGRDDDCIAEIEEITIATISRVRKKPKMYLVLRDGAKMQTSHLEPGDLPREPDDRGF